MKRRGNKIPQPRSDFIGGILFRCHKPFLFSLIKKAYEWKYMDYPTLIFIIISDHKIEIWKLMCVGH